MAAMMSSLSGEWVDIRHVAKSRLWVQIQTKMMEEKVLYAVSLVINEAKKAIVQAMKNCAATTYRMYTSPQPSLMNNKG